MDLLSGIINNVDVQNVRELLESRLVGVLPEHLFETLKVVESHKIMEIILNNGVNVNINDNEGNTLLHIAVDQGNLEIVSLLIDKGAALNIQNNKAGAPLHTVVYENKFDIAKLLIEKGTNPNT